MWPDFDLGYLLPVSLSVGRGSIRITKAGVEQQRVRSQQTISPLRFDSSALPESEQFSTYASGMVNFDVSRTDDGPFLARALVWRVGRLIIARAESDPVSLSRSRARVAADRVDHLYVNFYYRGRFTFDDGREERKGAPGSLLVIDMRQPCRLAIERNEDVSIAIPRHLLLRRLDGFDPHGLIARSEVANLFGAMLRTLCASLSKLPIAQGAAVEQMVVDLVAAAVIESSRSRGERASREEMLRSRVRAYIDGHLGDELDVASICRAFGISRSTLYRAFGDNGGVLRQIQARRLRQVRLLLSDPTDDSSITELAQATGFADPSHLTRAFKRAFGVTPGAFRRTPSVAHPPLAASDDDAVRRFSSWVGEVD